MQSLDRFLGLVVGLIVALSVTPVSAEARVPEPRPAVDVRAFGGFGSGLGAEAWWGDRVRVDLDLEATPQQDFIWGGAAVVLPTLTWERRFVGVRAGYQLEHLGKPEPYWRGSRFANTPYAGAVVHLESSRGSTFEGGLGVEMVLRAEAAVCCDSAALRILTFGAWLSARGELALTRRLALFGQVGLRTADHLLEIKVMPQLLGGVRLRFFGG